MTRDMTRRAILAGAPVVIAAAATITTGPAKAAALDSSADAHLFELEARWHDALRGVEEAGAKHDAIRDSLPEWAFGELPFPEENWLFHGVRRELARNRDGLTGRPIVTLAAIRDYNNNTELCAQQWRDMPPGAEREKLRNAWIERRAQGRQRVLWWQGKKAEQQQLIAAAGERDAAEASDDAVGVLSDIEEMIKAAPVATVAGLAVKLRVLTAWATHCGTRSEDEIEWDDDLTRVILADTERLAGGEA
jgi:hypothetical protein